MTLSHWHHNVTRTTSCVTRTFNELPFSVALLSDVHLALLQLRRHAYTCILSRLHLAYICLFVERMTTTKYLVLSISAHSIYFCSLTVKHVYNVSIIIPDFGHWMISISANGQQ